MESEIPYAVERCQHAARDTVARFNWTAGKRSEYQAVFSFLLEPPVALSVPGPGLITVLPLMITGLAAGRRLSRTR